MRYGVPQISILLAGNRNTRTDFAVKMEEKGRIPGMFEVSIAGPLSILDPKQRQWDHAYCSLIQNSSELEICINSKRDLKIKLTEGFKLTKLHLKKDEKHVFSITTIPANGIRELFMFGAKSDDERRVWLEKIQESCSMQRVAIEDSKQGGDSLPRTSTYNSNDSGFIDQETASHGNEPMEHSEDEDLKQAARKLDNDVSPIARGRCDDLERSGSEIICPHCLQRIRLIVQAQMQGSRKVPKENDNRTECRRASETDDRANEKRKE